MRMPILYSRRPVTCARGGGLFAYDLTLAIVNVRLREPPPPDWFVCDGSLPPVTCRTFKSSAINWSGLWVPVQFSLFYWYSPSLVGFAGSAVGHFMARDNTEGAVFKRNFRSTAPLVDRGTNRRQTL